MNNDTNIIKMKILDAIKEKVPSFRKISNTQYRMRCPVCGDSERNPNASHMYLKCLFDTDEPILYNCFKGNCNARGKVNAQFLKLLDISIDGIDIFNNNMYSKIPSIKQTNINIVTGEPILNSRQIRYIEKRIGSGLSNDDYRRFKIIWDINSIIPYIDNSRIMGILPSNDDSISFLSDDRSSILSRSFGDGSTGSEWRKIKIFQSPNRSFYTIQSTIDLFDKDTIYVNIAEGVVDILSVYKNFNMGNKSVYVAVLGSDYDSGIEYIITNGIIGSNVIINIYIDNDINDKILKYQLRKYKWIFGGINIYKNIRSKDFGVRIDDIQRLEYHL